MAAGLFLLALLTCFTRNIAKEVTTLPGLSEKLNFRHYSGYLQVSKTRFLHYWFAESQNDPSSDPLLLWLNGGPGCSSVGGLLTELGPFEIQDDWETVKLRPFSWNKFANVVFLESPAGVGYSYSTDGNITSDDDLTSFQNHNALKAFFTQFPQFRSNDFFITGESYGGTYIPTLVERIIDGNAKFPINIKGMAIGNGCVSNDINTDTLVNFAYNHGLIDQRLWETMETACCSGCADSCSFHSVTSGFCISAVVNISLETWRSGLNVYDLYRDCYYAKTTALANKRFRADLRGLAPAGAHALLQEPVPDSTTMRRYYASSTLPCVNQTAATNWMNRADVRQALHISKERPEWSDCSDSVSAAYTKIYSDVFAQFRKALKAGLRVLVYNGDTDMACNFLMGQQFCHQLNLKTLSPKRQWKCKDQVAGFVTRYKNLDFVTIKGAGHMVPQWKPEPAYKMITSFVFQRDY